MKKDKKTKKSAQNRVSKKQKKSKKPNRFTEREQEQYLRLAAKIGAKAASLQGIKRRGESKPVRCSVVSLYQWRTKRGLEGPGRGNKPTGKFQSSKKPARAKTSRGVKKSSRKTTSRKLKKAA